MKTCVNCTLTKAEGEFRITSYQPSGPYRAKKCRSCEAWSGIHLADAAAPSGGWIYVVIVPSGHVKIGYSSNPHRRWDQLAADFGGTIVPLALLPGDGRLEGWLHSKFDHLRQPRAGVIEGDGELFHPSPELLAWAVATGIPADVALAA